MEKVIGFIRTITRTVAITIMFTMMFFICFYIITRMIGTPIIGNVEFIRMAMVVLIMFGLSYAESEKGHIAIGLLVDHLPQKVKIIFDSIGSLLVVGVTVFISIVYFNVALNDFNSFSRSSSDLLSIPLYPFKFIIAFGFTLWSLEAFLNFLNSVREINKSFQ